MSDNKNEKYSGQPVPNFLDLRRTEEATLLKNATKFQISFAEKHGLVFLTNGGAQQLNEVILSWRKTGLDRLREATQNLPNVVVPETYQTQHIPGMLPLLPLDMMRGMDLSINKRNSESDKREEFLKVPTGIKLAALKEYVKAIKAVNESGRVFADHKTDSLSIEMNEDYPNGFALWIVDPGALEDWNDSYGLENKDGNELINLCKAIEMEKDRGWNDVFKQFFNRGNISPDLVPEAIRSLSDRYLKGEIKNIDQLWLELDSLSVNDINKAEEKRIQLVDKRKKVPEVEKKDEKARLIKMTERTNHLGDGQFGDVMSRVAMALKNREVTIDDIYEIGNILEEQSRRIVERELVKKGWKPPEATQ